MTPATKTRTRRDPEQRIADLQKQIESIKTRAERQKVKKSPVLRHLRAAVKSIDTAIENSDDAVMRKELSEARSTLSACLGLNGVVVPFAPTTKPAGARRARGEVGDLTERLLDYVLRNPGRRGEHIAAEIGTDALTMRLPMKKLIADGKVRTTVQRRGMAYFAA
jgi:hypothetical protein